MCPIKNYLRRNKLKIIDLYNFDSVENFFRLALV